MQIKFFINIIVILLISIPNKILALESSYICIISANPALDFGNIYIADNIPETATTVINVTCTNLSSTDVQNFTYTLIANSGNSNSQTNRMLKTVKNSTIYNAKYNMYTNNSYSTVFGDNSDNTTQYTMTYTLGAQQSRTDNFTIYGRMPVQTITSMGTYTDSITLTLTYSAN